MIKRRQYSFVDALWIMYCINKVGGKTAENWFGRGNCLMALEAVRTGLSRRSERRKKGD